MLDRLTVENIGGFGQRHGEVVAIEQRARKHAVVGRKCAGAGGRRHVGREIGEVFFDARRRAGADVAVVAERVQNQRCGNRPRAGEAGGNNADGVKQMQSNCSSERTIKRMANHVYVPRKNYLVSAKRYAVSNDGTQRECAELYPANEDLGQARQMLIRQKRKLSRKGLCPHASL